MSGIQAKQNYCAYTNWEQHPAFLKVKAIVDGGVELNAEGKEKLINAAVGFSYSTGPYRAQGMMDDISWRHQKFWAVAEVHARFNAYIFSVQDKISHNPEHRTRLSAENPRAAYLFSLIEANIAQILEDQIKAYQYYGEGAAWVDINEFMDHYRNDDMEAFKDYLAQSPLNLFFPFVSAKNSELVTRQPLGEALVEAEKSRAHSWVLAMKKDLEDTKAQFYSQLPREGSAAAYMLRATLNAPVVLNAQSPEGYIKLGVIDPQLVEAHLQKVQAELWQEIGLEKFWPKEPSSDRQCLKAALENYLNAN